MVKDGTYKQKTFFISGLSGAGKSTFAKQVAHWMVDQARKKGETWQIYNASAEHAFDSYAGQEVVILDDLRCYSMTPSDWLKLLDPYNVAQVSARYKNRGVVAKALIITSVHSPEAFFSEACRGQSEPIVQFIRRIMMHAVIYDAGGSRGVLLRELKKDPDSKEVRLAGYEQLGGMTVASYQPVPYYFAEGEWFGAKPTDKQLDAFTNSYEARSYKDSPLVSTEFSDSIHRILQKMSDLFD